MVEVSESVREFLDKVTPEKRRRDARTVLDLMTRVTGESPRLWSSVVGFGEYHYRYDSGREGDAAAAGFSPRKAATVIYLPDGVGAYEEQLRRLGPHTTGVGCLYLKDVEQVDLAALEEIVTDSYRSVTSGTYTARAREGGGRT